MHFPINFLLGNPAVAVAMAFKGLIIWLRIYIEQDLCNYAAQKASL